MSRRLLAFLLSELKTVRVVCHGPGCQTVLEMPLEALARVTWTRCPQCHLDLDPLANGTNPAAELARAVLKAQAMAKLFGLEFVLPDASPG